MRIDYRGKPHRGWEGGSLLREEREGALTEGRGKGSYRGERKSYTMHYYCMRFMYLLSSIVTPKNENNRMDLFV